MKHGSEFLEKMSKINKPLAKLSKRQNEETQVRKIRVKKKEITVDAKMLRESIDPVGYTLKPYITPKWNT